MMSEDEIARILAQLVGPSDKQLIANLRNFQILFPEGYPPATSASGETLLRLRHLQLLQQRPEHYDMPISEAEHILTTKGLMIGQVINQRCDVSIAIPNLIQGRMRAPVGQADQPAPECPAFGKTVCG